MRIRGVCWFEEIETMLAKTPELLHELVALSLRAHSDFTLHDRFKDIAGVSIGTAFTLSRFNSFLLVATDESAEQILAADRIDAPYFDPNAALAAFAADHEGCVCTLVGRLYEWAQTIGPVEAIGRVGPGKKLFDVSRAVELFEPSDPEAAPRF